MGTRLPVSCFDIRQGQVRFSSVKASYHLLLGKNPPFPKSQLHA